jgi:hypothetical protein
MSSEANSIVMYRYVREERDGSVGSAWCTKLSRNWSMMKGGRQELVMYDFG